MSDGEEDEALRGPDAWELANLLQKEEDNEEEKGPKWKKYARLILPHVGLIVLSCLYIITGAGIFYLIEKPHELTLRRDNVQSVADQREKLLLRMWELSNAGNARAKEKALGELENLTTVLFAAFDTHYLTAGQVNDGVNDAEPATWTFLAAIFFTSTLLTTIGYGNLVPVTAEGRIFCICYGLFGVPLILITSSSAYSETVGTMGSGTVAPEDPQNEDDEEGEDGGETPVAEMRKELEKFGLDDYISIPVSLVLLILIGYIAMGAVLLSFVEEWPFFQAFYFSFITMTTVGFGDIVPEKQAYYLLDLLYIIVGLAITTMCIDLVGIQYIRKIHYFGRAIQDARYALVNVGGRMVQVGDLMKYASVLQKKYGLAEGVEADLGPSCFVPKEIKYIRYIDYLSSASTSAGSLHTITSRPPSRPSSRYRLAGDSCSLGSGEAV